MHNFLKIHKEVAYNSDIPHSSCFCEVCETRTCDSSSKNCMLGNYPEYLKLGLSLSDFKADVDLISFLQWQRVEKKIVKVNQTIPFGQVIPKWVQPISNLKRHMYRKREQVASYDKQKDELKAGEALIHVDYSESYNNTQQDEIQSAYFGQQNFSIFTSYSYYREAEQRDLAKISIAVISESSNHSRIAAFTCTNAIVNKLKKDLLKKNYFVE